VPDVFALISKKLVRKTAISLVQVEVDGQVIKYIGEQTPTFYYNGNNPSEDNTTFQKAVVAMAAIIVVLLLVVIGMIGFALRRRINGQYYPLNVNEHQ